MLMMIIIIIIIIIIMIIIIIIIIILITSNKSNVRIRFLGTIEKINYSRYLDIVLIKNELNLWYGTFIFIFVHSFHIQNNMAAN